MGLCMEKITSRTNPYIKQACRLSASGGARKKNGQFLLEGVRLCCDVLNSSARPLTVFVTESCLAKNEAALAPLLKAAEKRYLISEEVSGRLADTVHPQGVFCVCTQGETDFILQKNGRYLMLDNVQDPSNLGAIIRTAEALGSDGLVMSGGADLYNPKALRASMGSILRFPVRITGDLAGEIAAFQRAGIKVLASVPKKEALPVTKYPMAGGLAIVVGNEAGGVSEPVLAAADAVVTIPMLGRAESLNAATAAVILIWEMMRRAERDS